MMLIVRDKQGQQIYLKDKVKFEAQIDLMGEIDMVEGYVIAIPSESMVQIQPALGGTPVVLSSDDVAVFDSLVQRVANLSTIEEFQALLAETEARHMDALEESKSKKKRTSGSNTKKSPAKISQDVDF